MAAAALAYENFPGARGERERPRVHQRIVEDQLGALENFRSAQGEQSGAPGRRRPDTLYPSIIPAATVWLEVSSIRIKEPVARFNS